MSRTLPTNISNALSDSFVIPVIFVQLEFDSGILYLHTDLGTIVTTDTSPNKTWLGAGDLGNVGTVEERNDLSPTAIQLQLSGLDSTIADECLNQNYYERPATLYLSLRNTVTGVLLDDPVEIFKGFMDVMQIISGPETATIQLTLESEFVEFDRAPMLYYTNTQQQESHSGDLFLEYVNAVSQVEILWGKSKYVQFSDRQPSIPGPWGPGPGHY